MNSDVLLSRLTTKETVETGNKITDTNLDPVSLKVGHRQISLSLSRGQIVLGKSVLIYSDSSVEGRIKLASIICFFAPITVCLSLFYGQMCVSFRC